MTELNLSIVFDSNLFTLLGTGLTASTGNGGQASSASLNGAADLFVDSSGGLFVLDGSACVIRKIDMQSGKNLCLSVDQVVLAC